MIIFHVVMMSCADSSGRVMDQDSLMPLDDFHDPVHVGIGSILTGHRSFNGALAEAGNDSRLSRKGTSQNFHVLQGRKPIPRGGSVSGYTMNAPIRM